MCSMHTALMPMTSQDLSRLGRDLKRTLLVDDTPLAFVRQPHNGLPVLTFRGDVDDRVLTEALLPVLETLNEEADVRPSLQKRFNMQRWFTAQVSCCVRGLRLVKRVEWS